MRAIRTCILASLAAVAACGGGSNKDVDALIIIPDAAIDAPPDAFEPVFDFACMGNTAPTTAQAMITLGGTVGEVVVSGTTPSVQAAHNATVAVCKGDCANANQLDTKTTPMMGCPAMGCPYTSSPVATGGTPLDVYVKATKTGNLTTYIYPPSPLTMNLMNAPVVMFASTTIQLLGLIGITQDAQKGIMFVAVADCANMPITDTANVTLSIKQDGQPVQGTTQVDASMFAAQLAGTFVIFNVPAGTIPTNGDPPAGKATEIGATYKTKTLLAHTVTVFPNSTTASAVRPGY